METLAAMIQPGSATSPAANAAHSPAHALAANSPARDALAANSLDDAAALPESQGEMAWKSISGCLESIGKSRFRELFAGLHQDEEYKAWLASNLQLKGANIPDIDQTSQSLSTTDLLGLPADMSRDYALRTVKPAALQTKMKDFTLAQEYRDWDVVVLCHLAPSGNGPRGEDAGDSERARPRGENDGKTEG